MKKTKNKNLTDIILYRIVDKFSDREDSVHERVISAEEEETITHRAVTYLRYGNGEVVMLDE